MSDAGSHPGRRAHEATTEAIHRVRGLGFVIYHFTLDNFDPGKPAAPDMLAALNSSLAILGEQIEALDSAHDCEWEHILAGEVAS